MELWKSKSNGQYFVTAQYNGKVAKMSGCPEELCPYSTVRDLLNSYRIPNYEEVAGVKLFIQIGILSKSEH